MTRTTKKVKVNVSLSEAQQAANQYSQNSIKKDKVMAEMNEKLQKIRETYEPKITEIDEALKEPTDVLNSYAIEQRTNWSGKSIELANCVIGFRTNPPSVGKSSKTTWGFIIGLMKANKTLKAFVKTKEDVDKQAILKSTADVKLIGQLEKVGVKIEQEEQFFVDTKKEATV